MTALSPAVPDDPWQPMRLPRDGATLQPAAMTEAWTLHAAVSDVVKRLAEHISAGEFSLDCGEPLRSGFADRTRELAADLIDRAGTITQ